MTRKEALKGTRSGFLGLEAFRNAQRSMRGLSERQRALYSVGMIFHGVESILKGKKAKGASEVVVGAERFVDATLNGIVKRAETSAKDFVGPLVEDFTAVRDLRASESEKSEK